MMEDHIQMIQLQGRHKGVQAESSCVDLQAIREGMGMMKLSYLHLLSDHNHLLSLVRDYTDALRTKEEEVDRLSCELEDTRASLVNTPLALQDLERHGGEFILHSHPRYSFG